MMNINPNIKAVGFTILLIGFFFSCSAPPRYVAPAFYHWKTHFDLSYTERQYLNNLAIDRLYVKFFDIDWDFNAKEAVPLATIVLGDKQYNYEIVPTIFVTNRTFLQIPHDQIVHLAEKTAQKINRIGAPFDIREVQIDCDWTAKTQDAYFTFLEKLKPLLAVNQWHLSTTIRLHQLKYAKRTGIPPADKGVLMIYNVDDLDKWSTPNSILSVPVAASYFVPFKSYPLHLDVALPIFEWGAIYRQDRLLKLINNLSNDDLADTAKYDKIAKNRFRIRKSHYIKGYYLYKDDFIRTESIPIDTLSALATKLSPYLSSDSLAVVFYHLDTTTIKKYPYERLQHLVQELVH